MKKYTRPLAVVALIILLATASPSGAYDVSKMPTTEKIKVLETDHFTILFQAPLDHVVPAVAGYCEAAYAHLTRLLDMVPDEKTRVYLVDNIDTHNGWATVVPHNTMAIYLAGTDQGSALYQPGNYLARTIYHEFMHVLSMDMRSGYNRGLEKVFGKVDPTVMGGDLLSYLLFLGTASPNMLSPAWYLEGIAMVAETEFAGPGRGRSTFGDMIFRSAVKDDNLIPYSQWYRTTPRWPYGSAAYWYGMRMVQYLFETGTHPNPMGRTTQAVSDAILFNFNSAIHEVAQKDWKTLAEEMLRNERDRQRRNLDHLETLPFTPLKRHTPSTIAVRQVRFSGHDIYLMATTEEARNTLYRFDPATEALKKIDSAKTPMAMGSLSASADGRHLYYTTLEIENTQNLWYELRRFDTISGESRLLTRKGRYRNVDVSPDGTRLAVISQRLGITHLLEVPVAAAGDLHQETTLATAGLEADLAAAHYSPDGRHIVYVHADSDHFALNLVECEGGDIRTLYRSPAQIIAPTWHPDGRQIVFGHDANGVYNLYRLGLDDDETPLPVTHGWGGLFFPSFSGDGRTLAAVNLDGFGPHLVTFDYAPEALSGHLLPRVTPRWPSGLTDGSAAAQPAISSPVADPTSPGRDYHSAAAIRPDFWTPWATLSTYGVQGGLAASFSDPAKHQEVLLMGGVESRYGSPLARIGYTYRGFKPDLHLYAGLGQRAYPDLLASPDTIARFDYAEETQLVGAAVTFPVWTRLNRQLNFNLGYEFLQRDGIDDLEDEYTGLDLAVVPSTDDQGSLWGRLDYFSGTAYGRSISVEDGILASAGVEISDPTLGGQVQATRAVADLNAYLTMSYLSNHVFKISGTYGAGWGDDFAQGLFGIGGFDVLPAAATHGIPQRFGLRGYDTYFQTGQRAVRAGAAYRLPILNLFSGFESAFPLYNRDLFLEVFYEGGRTFDDRGIGDDLGWLNAAGVEVNYGLTLLRYLSFAPGIGVVWAPQRSDRYPDDQEVVGYLSLKLWASF